MMGRSGALRVLAGAAAAATAAVGADATCLGEFQLCPATGECTLFECDGPGPHCGRGEYRCPVSNRCVKGAAGYSSCPGLAGTHLDHTLDTEERLDKLSAAANLTEQISQLTNAAPALERLGIPGYQWLNDDVHGVMSQGDTTSFPDGERLGAKRTHSPPPHTLRLPLTAWPVCDRRPWLGRHLG